MTAAAWIGVAIILCQVAWIITRLRRQKFRDAAWEDLTDALIRRNDALTKACEQTALDRAEARAALRKANQDAGVLQDQVAAWHRKMEFAVKRVEGRGYKNKAGPIERSEHWQRIKKTMHQVPRTYSSDIPQPASGSTQGLRSGLDAYGAPSWDDASRGS